MFVAYHVFERRLHIDADRGDDRLPSFGVQVLHRRNRGRIDLDFSRKKSIRVGKARRQRQRPTVTFENPALSARSRNSFGLPREKICCNADKPSRR